MDGDRKKRKDDIWEKKTSSMWGLTCIRKHTRQSCWTAGTRSLEKSRLRTSHRNSVSWRGKSAGLWRKKRNLSTVWRMLTVMAARLLYGWLKKGLRWKTWIRPYLMPRGKACRCTRKATAMMRKLWHWCWSICWINCRMPYQMISIGRWASWWTAGTISVPTCTA